MAIVRYSGFWATTDGSIKGRIKAKVDTDTGKVVGQLVYTVIVVPFELHLDLSQPLAEAQLTSEQEFSGKVRRVEFSFSSVTTARVTGTFKAESYEGVFRIKPKVAPPCPVQ